MSEEMITIEITKQAANCLAWFADHPFYGPTLSDVIVNQTEEWTYREGTKLNDLLAGDEFEYYQKQLTKRQT